MPALTYTLNGETYRCRKHGEGVVKWIDVDNVFFEREWWHVESTHEASGRIRVYRFWSEDGDTVMRRSGLSPSQSRLKYRPKPTEAEPDA